MKQKQKKATPQKQAMDDIKTEKTTLLRRPKSKIPLQHSERKMTITTENTLMTLTTPKNPLMNGQMQLAQKKRKHLGGSSENLYQAFGGIRR